VDDDTFIDYGDDMVMMFMVMLMVGLLDHSWIKKES